MDLSFVSHEKHRKVLREIIEELRTDPDVLGLMLIGSVARGDALPGADLDVSAIVRPGTVRALIPEVRHGVSVEVSRHEFDAERVRRNPSGGVYTLLDGVALWDPQGLVERSREVAREVLEAYRTPLELRGLLRILVNGARVKLRAALDAGDHARAGFVVTANAMAVVEAMWAINDLPVPVQGAVIAHREDLSNVPADLPAELYALFAGNLDERAGALDRLATWSLDRL